MCQRRALAGLLGLLLLALGVAGCGGDDDSGGGVASKPSEPEMKGADTGAAIDVREPSGGAPLSDNSVRTQLAVSNFKVDCRLAGTPNRSGVGHYHIELDGSLVNMYCRPAAAISMQNVEPGKHELEFLPATNDHTDDFGAEKKVSFTYKPAHKLPEITAEEKGKPSIRIVSPSSGSTVRGSFDLKVAPTNFELSCALYGKKDVAGYGHWHANVDSTSKGMMGMGTMLGMSCARTFHVSLAGIEPGAHTFFAILEDNQHAPTPKAQDSVRLNVAG
jgi:hypothetical protein